MANGGFTGNSPLRDANTDQYSGVWESQEQYADQLAGRWPYQERLLQRSLRFNAADVSNLSKTFGTSGNRRVWTFSFWAKRTNPGATQIFFGTTGTTDATYSEIMFRSDDKFEVALGYTSVSRVITTQVFRDPSAWYHFVVAHDNTQSLATNRIRVYCNGLEITSFSTDSRSTFSNTDLGINSTQAHYIGVAPNGPTSSTNAFSGYLCDLHFVDGQQLTPSAFGFFDGAGIWQPREYRGVYGNNGFRLDFSDNSTTAALGTDTSGNGNTWTVNNLNIDAAAFSNTIASSQTWSNYLTPSSSWDGAARDATKAFDSDLSTFAYVNSASTEYINFNFPSGISGHGGFIWLRGGNGNGQGLDNMTVTVNGSTVTSTARTGTSWNNWFRFPVSGTLTAFRITGPYPVLNAVSFWTDYSALVLDSQAITYGAPAFRDGDSLVDVPTNGSEVDTGSGGQVRGNYCTINPLNNGGVTLVNGNLDWTRSAGGSTAVAYSTIAVSSGKWYFETTMNGAGSGVNWECGVATTNTANNIRPGTTATGWGLVTSSNTIIYKQNSNSLTSIFSGTLSTGDVIGVAFDLDNGRIWFARNGTWLEGSPSAGTGASYTNLSGTVSAFFGGDGTAVNGAANFGARSFAYTAPSGFKALNTSSLPAPVVTKPSTVMDVALYTGNGSTQTISGLGFSPDFVWTKTRSQANNNFLFDSVRGVGNWLISDLTNAETYSANTLTSFNSDGFTTGSNNDTNGSGRTFVAWTWDAGSSTVTNTQGSITSSVRANASAGFSIVTYTGTGANATVGHGLGVTPGLIIVKNRTTAWDWFVWTTGFGTNDWLELNTTDAKASFSGTWGASAPSSTTFGISSATGVGANTNNYVAYCFAPVVGYSSFGSYVGNGSSDGVFVYTGFRPRWVMIKASSSTGDWYIIDTARDIYNLSGKSLQANTSNAEPSIGGSFSMTDDILSNGFKLRDGGSGSNGSSVTYIYAAFAESPFQYARAR